MRPDPLCNQKTVAERLDISERTLERWRVEGTGPTYLKAGRRVLYRQSDVDTWLNASKRVSTSQVLEAD